MQIVKEAFQEPIKYIGSKETFRTMIILSVMLIFFFLLLFIGRLITGQSFTDFHWLLMSSSSVLMLLYAVHLIALRNTDAQIETKLFVVKPWMLAIPSLIAAIGFFSKLSLRAFQ